MLEEMWGKGSTYSLLEGDKLVQPLVPQEAEINLPQDQAIPLLVTYSKDSASYFGDSCSSMFIVALFIVARN